MKKAVLLAAGRSLRAAPIPDKNFLQFLGKPLVAHQIEALIDAEFKEILVVGGIHNLALLRRLAKGFSGKVAVREQKDLDLGMAGAVLTAETWIKNEPFFMISANDVAGPELFAAVRGKIKISEGLLVAYKVSKYFPGGYLKVNTHGVITKIVEKPGAGHEPSKLVNIVMHYHPLPSALFKKLRQVSTKRDDRYEAALQELFGEVVYRALPYNGFWQPIKYPWHVLDLMKYYIENIEKRFPHGRIGGRPAEVAASAVIGGTDVYFEDGVKIMDHATVIGPAYIGKNSVVATGALVRNSHIGENCVIGFGSEVARSYLGDHVWTHTNYIGDSIIGSDVSFGAGTVTGNLRLDEKEIFVPVRGEKIGSGKTKLGLITGDHIRVGINTSFMPGVKVGSNSFVGAGITVSQDIPENSFVTGEWKLKVKPNREKISVRKKI